MVLFEHYIAHHSNTNRFPRQSELRKHLKQHSKERKYHCPYTEICSKSFCQRHKLNDHIRVHTGERPFGCDFCHKTFRIKNNMKKHLRIHTGEKPYLCSVCYKRFSSKSGLNSHMKHCHDPQDLQRRKEMMGNSNVWHYLIIVLQFLIQHIVKESVENDLNHIAYEYKRRMHWCVLCLLVHVFPVVFLKNMYTEAQASWKWVRRSWSYLLSTWLLSSSTRVVVPRNHWTLAQLKVVAFWSLWPRTWC